MRFHSRDGQVLLPGLALVLIATTGFLMFMQWGQRRLWQMRMNLAADAAALSAARTKAAQLNSLSMENMLINVFLTKAKVPLADIQAGAMPVEKYPGFRLWNKGMRTAVTGFNRQPALVGYHVASLNGSQRTLYSRGRYETGSLLAAQPVHILLYSKSTPPVFVKRYIPEAYYAREWQPRFRKAQPPHRSTWITTREGVTAASSARVWLDAPPSDFFNNGGFPRTREPFWGDFLIQGFYPQFNARLAAIPRFYQVAILAKGAGL